MIIVDWDVYESLLENRLSSALNRGKGWFTILFGVSKDRVDYIVSITHLYRLEESLVLARVLEDVGLQVPVRHKDGDSGDIFECLLESLNHLLHGLIWRL